jgi:hypothetical protein
MSRSHCGGSLRPYSRFLDRSRYYFFQVASSSVVLTRLSGPRSRPTTQKLWQRRESNPNHWICSQELWPLDHRGGRWSKILVLNVAQLYNYHHYSGHYPLSCLLFYTRRFGDWSLSLPSCGDRLALSVGWNWIVPPEDGDRIQSPKRRVLNRRQDCG